MQMDGWGSEGVQWMNSKGNEREREGGEAGSEKVVQCRSIKESWRRG